MPTNDRQETQNDLQGNTVASTKRHYLITPADLPLCCPMPNMRLWDSHPRVYLPIEQAGKVTCPYCEADYTLVGDQVEQTTISE